MQDTGAYIIQLEAENAELRAELELYRKPFLGWWEVDDKITSPEPWETFKVILHGEEAGDIVDEPDKIREILAMSREYLAAQAKE